MTSFPLVHHHDVNPDLARLQPYPFETLRQLFPNFIRIALVAPREQCIEAARRINDFCLSL
jgi:hypothetical protein